MDAQHDNKNRHKEERRKGDANAGEQLTEKDRDTTKIEKNMQSKRGKVAGREIASKVIS